MMMMMMNTPLKLKGALDPIAEMKCVILLISGQIHVQRLSSSSFKDDGDKSTVGDLLLCKKNRMNFAIQSYCVGMTGENFHGYHVHLPMFHGIFADHIYWSFQRLLCVECVFAK